MKYNYIRNVFRIVVILICVIFNLILYINYDELNIICTIFSIIVLSCLFFYDFYSEKYVKDILYRLSEMIECLANLKEEKIFSDTEDNMLSKLQVQTLRLVKILKSENNRISNEKNQIQSLISDISHQLKTPLSNLKMYSELLMDEDINSEEAEEFNKIILQSVDRMIFLVESMIKMSRLEAGIIKLRIEKNSLNEMIEKSAVMTNKKAEEKNIKVIFEKDKDIEISFDKKWSTEALFNIIENAVKYSKENGDVKIKVIPYELFVRIDVEDYGVGIAEEEVPKVFQRFYRGKNTLEQEGIGIGLYLSRKIISMENGYIKITPKKLGCVFSVFLPKR